MKKLFLCSSFEDVTRLFLKFVKENISGKTVTFIPTASKVEEVDFYVDHAKNAFAEMGVIIDELDVSKAEYDVIQTKLERNDFIYVSGGNTFFLLQELKRSGADKFIRQQVDAGKLYIGESAGAMVVSPNIEYVQDMDDCQKALHLKEFDALDIVDFYPLPHHTNFPFAEAVDEIILKYKSKITLCTISNTQAILVEAKNVKIEGV